MALELGELLIDELDVKAVEEGWLEEALDDAALDEAEVDEAALVEAGEPRLVLEEMDGILAVTILELEELDGVKLVVDGIVDDNTVALESA